MTDRPILFSAPMIRALLAGTKTQTRRVIKPQPETSDLAEVHAGRFAAGSRFLAGDRLWVRETWRAKMAHDGLAPSKMPQGAAVSYEADGHYPWASGIAGKLRPSMFMPRWASRLTLHVTDVRVERLQAISDADAWAEGISADAPIPGIEIDIDGQWWANAPRGRYGQLWDKINGEGAWMKNPWVVAISFIVERCNIEQATEESKANA